MKTAQTSIAFTDRLTKTSDTIKVSATKVDQATAWRMNNPARRRAWGVERQLSLLSPIEARTASPLHRAFETATTAWRTASETLTTSMRTAKMKISAYIKARKGPRLSTIYHT